MEKRVVRSFLLKKQTSVSAPGFAGPSPSCNKSTRVKVNMV